MPRAKVPKLNTGSKPVRRLPKKGGTTDKREDLRETDPQVINPNESDGSQWETTSDDAKEDDPNPPPRSPAKSVSPEKLSTDVDTDPEEGWESASLSSEDNGVISMPNSRIQSFPTTTMGDSMTSSGLLPGRKGSIPIPWRTGSIRPVDSLKQFSMGGFLKGEVVSSPSSSLLVPKAGDEDEDEGEVVSESEPGSVKDDGLKDKAGSQKDENEGDTLAETASSRTQASTMGKTAPLAFTITTVAEIAPQAVDEPSASEMEEDPSENLVVADEASADPQEESDEVDAAEKEPAIDPTPTVSQSKLNFANVQPLVPKQAGFGHDESQSNIQEPSGGTSPGGSLLSNPVEADIRSHAIDDNAAGNGFPVIHDQLTGQGDTDYNTQRYSSSQMDPRWLRAQETAYTGYGQGYTAHVNQTNPPSLPRRGWSHLNSGTSFANEHPLSGPFTDPRSRGYHPGFNQQVYGYQSPHDIHQNGYSGIGYSQTNRAIRPPPGFETVSSAHSLPPGSWIQTDMVNRKGQTFIVRSDPIIGKLYYSGDWPIDPNAPIEVTSMRRSEVYTGGTGGLLSRWLAWILRVKG